MILDYYKDVDHINTFECTLPGDARHYHKIYPPHTMDDVFEDWMKRHEENNGKLYRVKMSMSIEEIK